jgi:hypothetical protein
MGNGAATAAESTTEEGEPGTSPIMPAAGPARGCSGKEVQDNGTVAPMKMRRGRE